MIAGNARKISSISFRLLILPTLTQQNCWAIAPCGPTKGKVAILSDEDRRAREGFVPNLQIGSCLQAEVDNVNGLTAGLAQCLCERRRKLRVDQREQSLFRRDDGMVRLAGGKGQNRIDVGAFKIRIFLKDRLAGLAGRQQTKNVCDRNAQAANARTAVHSIGIDRYSFQKLWNRRHHPHTIALSAAFVRPDKIPFSFNVISLKLAEIADCASADSAWLGLRSCPQARFTCSDRMRATKQRPFGCRRLR